MSRKRPHCSSHGPPQTAAQHKPIISSRARHQALPAWNGYQKIHNGSMSKQAQVQVLLPSTTATIGHEPSKSAKHLKENRPCQQKSPASSRGPSHRSPCSAPWCPAALCHALHTHGCLGPHHEQPERASKKGGWHAQLASKINARRATIQGDSHACYTRHRNL